MSESLGGRGGDVTMSFNEREMRAKVTGPERQRARGGRLRREETKHLDQRGEVEGKIDAVVIA